MLKTPLEDLKAVVVRMTPESRKRLKLASVMFGISFTEVLDNALREWFNRHEVREKVLNEDALLSIDRLNK